MVVHGLQSKSMETVTVQDKDGVTNVVVTKQTVVDPKVEVRTIPYDTIVGHIIQISDSITKLEDEKKEYELLLAQADSEIAKR